MTGLWPPPGLLYGFITMHLFVKDVVPALSDDEFSVHRLLILEMCVVRESERHEYVWL